MAVTSCRHTRSRGPGVVTSIVLLTGGETGATVATTNKEGSAVREEGAAEKSRPMLMEAAALKPAAVLEVSRYSQEERKYELLLAPPQIRMRLRVGM